MNHVYGTLHARRAVGAGLALLLATAALAIGIAPAASAAGGDRGVSRRGFLVPIVEGAGDGTTSFVGPSAAEAFGDITPHVVAQAHIAVNYTGFTAAAKTAFQAAVNYWAATIASPVTITINAKFADLGHNSAGFLILGSAGPNNFYRDFGGAPKTHTFYPVALANRLHGSDLDPTGADIVAQFTSNPAADWFFGTNNAAPSNKINFESVVMHELGHGLGFIGSWEHNGSLGRFGFGTGFPFIYDRFVRNNAGTQLISMPNTSTTLGTALVNPVYFTGAKTPKSKLYAPNPYQSGSSISHLDEATFPRGNPNALMTPAISPGENVATAGPITLAVFQDMGWLEPLGTAAHDVTGDRNNDFIARAASTGVLYTYGGNGTGGILPGFSVGSGFNAYSGVVVTRDWNGDNVPDIIGRKSNGTFYLLRGNGIGKYAAPVAMASGANAYNAFVAPGDWNGDGKSDLLARKPDGSLWLLRGNGATGFGAITEVTVGWNAFNFLLSPGDFTGDAKPDLIGRKPDGHLTLFRGNGTGGFAGSSPIVSPVDWNTLTLLFSPGDFNGDGKSDLLGRKSDGTLWMFRGNNAGGFLGNSQIGSGFNTMNLLK